MAGEVIGEVSTPRITGTLTVAVADTDALTDGNSPYDDRVFTYQWFAANGATILGETGPDYAIPPNIHAGILAGGNAPWLEIVFSDPLGNNTTLTATVGLVDGGNRL